MFAPNWTRRFCACGHSSKDRRCRAYKVAKDLYDCRSITAHGGSLPQDDISVGREKLTLYEVANRAKAELRYLIQTLLPYCGEGSYRRAELWERLYFDR